MNATETTPETRSFFARCGDLMALGLMVLVVMRILLPMTHQVTLSWGDDLLTRVVSGVGPQGALIWDIAMLVLLTLALLWRGVGTLTGQLKGQLWWVAGLLWAGGSVMVLYHGWPLGGGGREGIGWAAGMSALIVAMIVGQDALRRRWLLSGMVALGIAVAMEAVEYRYVIYPENVAEFKADPEGILQSFGMTPGSPQAESFERRLMSTDISGDFTTSNILGVVLIVPLLLSAGIWCALFSVKAAQGRQLMINKLGRLLLMLIAVGSAFGLILTQSKGAMGAVVLGVLMLGGLLGVHKLFKGKVTQYQTGLGMGIALVVLCLPLLAVMMRWQQGIQEGVVDQERSLLFRAFYWMGTWELYQEASILGYGPGALRDLYLSVRSPMATDEIQSAHHMGLDWIVSLGWGGWCWVGLLLFALMYGVWQFMTRRETEPEELSETDAKAEPAKKDWRVLTMPLWAGGLPLLLFVGYLPIMLKMNIFDSHYSGLILFIGGWWLLSLMKTWSSRWINAALLAASAALLVHGQIDMGWTNTMSLPFLAMALGMLMTNAPSATAEDVYHGQKKHTNSEEIEISSSMPLRYGAMAAGGLICVISVACAWLGYQSVQVEKRLWAIQANTTGAEREQLAKELQETAPAESRQWFLVGNAYDSAGRPMEVYRVLKDQSMEQSQRPSHWLKMKAYRAYRLGVETQDKALLEQSRLWALEAHQRNPQSTELLVLLSDLALAQGDFNLASDYARQALEVDAMKFLDPLVQLDEASKKRLSARAGQRSSP